MRPFAGMRHVIVHYHIFKNAGTSVDACLEDSFGFLWNKFDLDDDWANITSDALYEYLAENWHLRALSSHQARWPEPVGEDLRVHPIVFLRHPIDRVGSMYTFAVRRDEAFARDKTLGAYVDRVLDPEAGFVARSAQTLFLSDDDHLTKPPGPATEVTPDHLRQALARLRHLPCFGVVERFGDSMALLQRTLQPLFPDLALVPRRENASVGRGATLADRVHELRQELGEPRYRRLVAANEADMELWDEARRIFNTHLRHEWHRRTGSSEPREHLRP